VTRRLEEVKSNFSEKRPIIHTFYQATGVDTPIVQQELLDTWKNVWYDAGWEPVVLTLEDAMRHRHFEAFDKLFDQAEFKTNKYNRFCFYRWLAMATVEKGGWMSDYDTFPLHSFPEKDGLIFPNDGKFTVYQSFVPALLSGSHEEWDRMAKLLMDSYKNHRHEFWSDMRALIEIKETSGSFISQSAVQGIRALYDESFEYEDILSVFESDDKCQKTRRHRAIHFSHSDCSQVGFCHGNRGPAIQKWVTEWRSRCFYSEDLNS